MARTPNEAAEALGLAEFTMKVNGGRTELTFRPLSLGQRKRLEQREFKGENEMTSAVLFESAQRGGFAGTQDEFDDLLEGDEIILASEKLGELCPLTTAAGEKALAAATSQPPDLAD